MKVTIVKRYERKFRLPLYNLLRSKLASDGIFLELIVGQINKYEEKNIKDSLIINPYGEKINNKYFYWKKHFISYQNVFRNISDSDLIIVQQSNSELLNYLLLLKRKLSGKFKLAFWGHGMNLKLLNKNKLSQKFKLYITKHVDHFFAYNYLSFDLIANTGYPKNNITILNNTIDVGKEKSIYDAISKTELIKKRKEFCINEGDKVGIYCGSLYTLKKIDFLLESLNIIKREYPNFHFIILGDGELKEKVKKYELYNYSWFHYVGFKTGYYKQIFLKLSDIQLIPGSVGLNIIDSFYSMTPLVTIINSNHGPEINYLINGENGLFTEDDIYDYANTVVNILRDPIRLEELKLGCAKSAKLYTIENMADNFYHGIVKTLKNDE